nr:hypothetical protein GCM10020063_035820 [Dactylosporangium thailandense]
MRLLTLAAGAAVGYVLGARAGREKYEQIVASTGRLRANPTPGQAVQTVQELFSAPAPAATTPVKALPTPAEAVPTPTPTSTAAPKPRKRTAAKTAPKTGPVDLDSLDSTV